MISTFFLLLLLLLVIITLSMQCFRNEHVDAAVVVVATALFLIVLKLFCLKIKCKIVMQLVFC